MNIKEFVGVDSYNRIENGVELTHEEFYSRVIQKMGGLDAIIPYIPYDFKTLKDAYTINIYFNTSETSLRGWDSAASNMMNALCNKYGITCISLSEGVCILKTAAKMWMDRKA